MFDQHVTCRDISVSLNVNTGIALGNNRYVSKYAGSTYLTAFVEKYVDEAIVAVVEEIYNGFDINIYMDEIEQAIARRMR